MSKVRPKQIAVEGAVPGQLLGLVGTEWAPVNPPAGGGGGGGGGGSSAFFDSFDRPDTPLVGDNGWVATDPTQMATFYIEGNIVKQTGFGNAPVVHLRDGAADPTIADVTVLFGFGVSGAVGSSAALWCAADLDYATTGNGIFLGFDGSGWYDIERFINGGGESPTTVTDHGWVAWTVADQMKIRMVYTESTRMLDVYQNDVLALSCDMNDTNFGYGHELPLLTTMAYAGFASNSGTHSHTFNDFSIDQSDGTGGGVVVPPAFDITDTPVVTPDPGYAYLTSAGKARIWNGTQWRQFLTTAYYPPGEDDAIFMLPSLVGRYVAEGLAFADGDPVTAWPDISGLSNDLVVTTAGTMKDVGIGSNKSVEFAKATLYQLPAAVPTPNTVIAVIKNTDGGTGSLLFSDAANHYVGILVGAGMRVSDGSSVYIDHPLSNYTDPHIIYGRVDASGGGGMDAGADDGRTHSAATIPFSVLRLGNWAAGLGYSMQGLVSEILIYDTVLTDSQLDAIVNQLKLIYGIA